MAERGLAVGRHAALLFEISSRYGTHFATIEDDTVEDDTARVLPKRQEGGMVVERLRGNGSLSTLPIREMDVAATAGFINHQRQAD
jgi:hypothetical protein